MGWDRVGLVRDVSTILADEDINMVGLRTDESGDGLVTLRMAVEASGVAQLQARHDQGRRGSRCLERGARTLAFSLAFIPLARGTLCG